MRRILSSLLFGALIVTAVAGIAAPREASAGVPTTATASIESGRHAPSGDFGTSGIFGKWWKKFKKIVESFLNFIDGVIDTIGGGSERHGGLGMLSPDRALPLLGVRVTPPPGPIVEA